MGFSLLTRTLVWITTTCRQLWIAFLFYVLRDRRHPQWSLSEHIYREYLSSVSRQKPLAHGAACKAVLQNRKKLTTRSKFTYRRVYSRNFESTLIVPPDRKAFNAAEEAERLELATKREQAKRKRSDWPVFLKDDDLVVIYVHGGQVRGLGPSFCDVTSYVYDRWKVKTNDEKSMKVLGLEYFLSDDAEHAYDDWNHSKRTQQVLDAYRYVVENEGVSPSKIAVLADSHGAAAALSAMLQLKDSEDDSKLPLPAQLILVSPVVDWTLEGEGGRADHVDGDALRAAAAVYAAEQGPQAPRVSPLLHPPRAFKGLCPTLVVAGHAAAPFLKYQTTTLLQKLNQAGVKTSEHIAPNMFSGFYLIEELEAAKLAHACIAQCLVDITLK